MALNFQLPIFIVISSLLVNSSPISAQSSALATWYGPPDGPGSGGACGFANDVGQAPCWGMISAGNANIFRGGQGCGECFEVQCSAPQCSGKPIIVTITDECPGACNDVPYHFDLSGKAFGAMAKDGQADNLRKLGQVDITYKRVQCNYPSTKITFKLDEKINPYHFACAVEFENGDGDISLIEYKAAGSNQWTPMQRSWGQTWAAGINPETKGPISFRVTTLTSKKTLVAPDAVPPNWAAGATYHSTVNF